MNTRVVAARLWVDWNFDGSFTQETTWLISARGDMRLVPVGDGITSGRGIVSSMSLSLNNRAGRYSPLRVDGALYNYLLNGGAYQAPCHLEISIDNQQSFQRVFTGVIKLPRESALTWNRGAVATIEARSTEEKLLNQRASTLQTQFVDWHNNGATEAQIIADILAGASAAPTTIDAGVFALPWVWLDDDSVAEQLWQIAGATGGRYYVDPDGRHCYENFAHWQTAQRSLQVQYRLTKDDYQNLDAWYEDKDLYSEIKIDVAVRDVAYSTKVWSHEQPVMIYPGSTEEIIAELDQPLYAVEGITYIARTLGGTDASASIAVTPIYYAQRVKLTIQNTGTVLVAVAKLTIHGQLVEPDAPQTITKTVTVDGDNGDYFTNRGITRTRKISSQRIQTSAQAQSLAAFLLALSERPKLVFKINGLRGLPDLRLGDRIRIADSDWHYQNGLAGPSATMMSGGGRTLGGALAIEDKPIIIGAGVTVTVTKTWTIQINDQVGRTVSANETITDLVEHSSQTVSENGPVVIPTGVTVTVQDTWILYDIGHDAYVTAISWHYDASGFRQDIEAIAVNGLYPNDGNYFRLNIDTLGSARKVFF